MNVQSSYTPRESVQNAFLTYRLNANQADCLASKVGEGQRADEAALTDRFEAALAGDDCCQQASCEGDAIAELQREFEALPSDQPWTARQRAIYRRLSQPDYEPETLPTLEKAVMPDPELVRGLREAFPVLDRNNSLHIEERELDYLMTGGMYGEARELPDSPEGAAAVAIVGRYQDLLGSVVPHDGEGVTLHDIELFADQGIPGQPLGTARINEIYAEYRNEAARMAEGALFADERISPEHIHQGSGGSCVLLATAAGLSQGELSSMFEQTDQGNYRVAFADGREETVHEPTLAERLYHSQGADHERWPALLELAFAQRSYSDRRSHDDQTGNSFRSGINGVDPTEAMRALTGRSASQYSLDERTLDQARELLSQAMTSDGPVVCGSRMQPLGGRISPEELNNGIANSHAYTVLGYDAETDLVSLQNPWHRGEWAHQDSPDDGLFEMPLVDFYTSFRWVGFADER